MASVSHSPPHCLGPTPRGLSSKPSNAPNAEGEPGPHPLPGWATFYSEIELAISLLIKEGPPGQAPILKERKESHSS